MFNIVFIFIFIVFIAVLVKNISEWNHNNHSPLLSVQASVKSKRTSTNTHQHPNGGDATGAQGFHTITTTDFYITFQVESGDRIEFRISEKEYGLLCEGDYGKLSFQGTRFIGFERCS